MNNILEKLNERRSVSVKRAGSHLFLRHAFDAKETTP